MMKYFLYLMLAVMPVIGIAEEAEKLPSFSYTDEAHCYAEIGQESPENVINLIVQVYLLGHAEKKVSMDGLETALKRGCSLNENDKLGFPPLVSAVLFNNDEMVEFLLTHGADKDGRVDNPSVPIHDMNATEALEWVLAKEASEDKVIDRSRVQALLAK